MNYASAITVGVVMLSLLSVHSFLVGVFRTDAASIQASGISWEEGSITRGQSQICRRRMSAKS